MLKRLINFFKFNRNKDDQNRALSNIDQNTSNDLDEECQPIEEPEFMFNMETDEKGNFITVSCVKCYKDVRVECKDASTVAEWNEDLRDQMGGGVYILCETRCPKCEKAMQDAENHFIQRDDAGYQFLTYDGEK